MISPLENNGMMLRTQDYSALKHNEDTNASNQHINIQSDIDKNDDKNAHSVTKKENSDGADTHHDAREEGRNKYFNMRRNKKNDKVPDEGKVTAKKKGGFDIIV